MDTIVTTSDNEAFDHALIYKAYEAFNRRDISGMLALMHEEVHWPNGWEGGYVTGHNEVREYWTRQWKEIDPHVTPVALSRRENGALEVAVQQLIKDRQGNILFNGRINHIYKIEDGQIRRMEIEQP